MAGFTAINTRAISAPTPIVDDAFEEKEIESAQQKTTKRRQPARKKTASPDADSQVATSKPAPKRIGGKGRKRTNEPGDEPSSKRRRSGSVDLNLLITKPGVNASTAKDPKQINRSDVVGISSTDADLISLASKTKLNGFRYSTESAVRANTLESKSATSHPVYMPHTSMDSFTQAQPQTTMQVLQSSQAGSSVLYPSSIGYPTTNYEARSSPAFTNFTPLPVSTGTTHTMSNAPPTQPPTPVNSDSPVEITKCSSRWSEPKPKSWRTHAEDFEKSIHEDDDEMIELAKRIEMSATPGDKSPPTRARKLNIRETHQYDDYGGALFTEEERELLDSIKLPQDAQRPIVRSKFPLPIMDRTSLAGVSNTSALRTCFRVGEALNTGCHAVRNNRSLILELYARVTSSWRDEKPSRKQHFIFGDLYHDKPPFINGTFELWDQSTLWDEDSKPFLAASSSGMLCRMIAKMKRDGASWRLEILNIWQADWDDIEHAADIYARPTTEGGA